MRECWLWKEPVWSQRFEQYTLLIFRAFSWRRAEYTTRNIETTPALFRQITKPCKASNIISDRLALHFNNIINISFFIMIKHCISWWLPGNFRPDTWWGQQRQQASWSLPWCPWNAPADIYIRVPFAKEKMQILTMFYTMNSYPLLITKWVFMLIIILSQTCPLPLRKKTLPKQVS